MTLRPAAFAIPGDIDQKTGGYIYERTLLMGLREEGRAVQHLILPASFPNATEAETEQAIAQMSAVPADVPLIIDGLVYGGLATHGFSRIKAPIVAMIHHPLGLETGLPAARARALLALEKANLEYADHVVVPSPHTAHILTRDFAVKAERISIAPPGFEPAQARLPRAGAPLILSVGLLAARKGHDVLIDALAAISDLDWYAEIVGGTHDPAIATALADQIEALGLGQRIRLAGLVDDAHLRRLYREAHLFALATRYEGYGMAFGDAMTHGLPIVTCSAGAVPDTVPATAGHLVAVNDPAAFAAALRNLLTDTAAYDAKAQGSAAAGAQLPRWTDTVSVMSGVLDQVRVSPARPA